MNSFIYSRLGGALQAHQSGIKTKKGGRYENQHESVWSRYVLLAQKMQNIRHFYAQKIKDKKYF